MIGVAPATGRASLSEQVEWSPARGRLLALDGAPPASENSTVTSIVSWRRIGRPVEAIPPQLRLARQGIDPLERHWERDSLQSGALPALLLGVAIFGIGSGLIPYLSWGETPAWLDALGALALAYALGWTVYALFVRHRALRFVHELDAAAVQQLAVEALDELAGPVARLSRLLLPGSPGAIDQVAVTSRGIVLLAPLDLRGNRSLDELEQTSGLGRQASLLRQRALAVRVLVGSEIPVVPVLLTVSGTVNDGPARINGSELHLADLRQFKPLVDARPRVVGEDDVQRIAGRLRRYAG